MTSGASSWRPPTCASPRCCRWRKRRCIRTTGKRRDAARDCDRAIAGQEDFALAHLLAARAAASRAETIRHLRRAIDISPDWPTPWRDLEALYRSEGDRKALQALGEERRVRASGKVPE